MSTIKAILAAALIICLLPSAGFPNSAGQARINDPVSSAKPGRNNPLSPLNQGGPDTFGYTYKDSNESGGPIFSWEEISATVNQIQYWCGPDYSCELPIGFNFPFYRNIYTGVYFNIEGYISFGKGYGTIPTGSIPSLVTPNNEIAIFGGDLRVSQKTKFYYQTLSNPTRFVLEAKDLYLMPLYDLITFEAILYPNGDIVSLYQSLLGNNSNYVGIENEVGGDGLAYVHPLADNLAVRYYYPFGALFHPSKSMGYGRVGKTVSYRIQLENKTGMETPFSLSLLTGNQWNTIIPVPQTPSVKQDDSVTVGIKVSIPPTAAVGEKDVAIIQATALNSPNITGTTTLTTTATSENLGYVPVSAYNYVSKIDPVTHALAGTIDLAGTGCIKPERVSIPPDGKTIWFSCNTSEQVILIDKEDDHVVKVLNGIPSPAGIGFSLDGKYAFVGNVNSSQVSVINRSNYQKTSIPVSAPVDTIVSHPYLPLIYTTNRIGGLVSVIDTNTLAVVNTINTGQLSYWAAISHDGQRLYISDTAIDTVSVIDTQANQVIRKITIGPYGGHISDLETSLDDAKLFVNVSRFYEYARVDLVDTNTFAIEKHIVPANTETFKSAVLNCDGTELYVIDPGAFYNDTLKNISVINTSSYSVTYQISMPDLNHDRHIDPSASDIALCPQFDARPLILPPYQLGFGQPGQTFIFHFTVTNQIPFPDSDIIDLETSGNVWPVTLSANNTGNLGWKESFSFTLSLTIPQNATLGNKDETILIARSTHNSSILSSIRVVTRYAIPVYLPIVAGDH